MEVTRYKYVFIIIAIFLNCISTEKSNHKDHNSSNCPFTKIIEDIFKIHNKTSEAVYLKDSERAKLFLNTIANVTSSEGTNESLQEELVNDIIASINKIKNNMTSARNANKTKLDEAIILKVPNESKTINKDKIQTGNKGVNKIISGIEDKIDIAKGDIDNKTKNTVKNPNKTDEIKPMSTTEKSNYVEILSIEPNNTSPNNITSHNIIEILKHLMPMFNSTLTKELHNITIIERNRNNNHSFSATKNVSTIVVTYCDNQNLSKVNGSINSDADTILKVPINDTFDYDYYVDDDSAESDEEFDYESLKSETNLTAGEKKDILEATEYGMQKMHELYSVMEPKLYSMGLWLDETNPARYVAAFNAPSEDIARYSRYGYASLQAATKLRQLISGGIEDGLEGRTEEPQFPSASALRQSPLMQHCPLRGAPKCPPASKRYRTHDGTCNNIRRPRWGSTMTPVQRFLAPSYSDGLQAPRRSVFGSALPSAREISSLIHEDQNVENPGVTHLLMQWGQFLDHDVTSSSQSRGFNGSVPRCCKDGGRDFVPREFLHPECMPIAVPPSDPFYGPRGVRCLDFVRSSPAPRDDCSLGWRDQLNQVSAYIDGSPLYASSARQSDKLRLFRNGMLQYGRVQQRRPLLPPERRDELCRGGAVSIDCFKSGDARVNEHPGLVAAHIVWLRQHNRMAQELAHLNPHWSDEKIYQETRKIVGAMVQHITYREFLPIVLGPEVMRLFELEPLKKGFYKDYSPKINPNPASGFSSAAFRFGHSLVQSSMVRYDRFHRPINNNVSLHNEPTNPSNIWSMGAVDRLLLGMINQPIQKRDEFMTEELTNHLFQTPQFDFGMDLAAINIQRGRDHGIPPYTSWREPCGLSPIEEFEDLFRVMPARAVRKLKVLYRQVDDIDLFTGGMAERPVVGGLVGPTFACIIAQQFSNLRKGDRFWYENGGFDSSFTPAQLQRIRRISFAQVLCRTLDSIDSIQPFVFLSPDNLDNERISCHNGLLNNFDLSPWVEINSESNNDISKSDDEPLTTQKPKRTKPPTITSTTTKRPTTTKKSQRPTTAAPNKNNQKKHSPLKNSTVPLNVTKEKLNHKVNSTDTTTNDKDRTETVTVDNNSTKTDATQKIDDKLDFKNKSRRFEIDRIDSRLYYDRPTKQYDYDDEDVQSVQSVIVNNVPRKRPYNRPVIAVTENVNKYTYLINYVPRSTQSWRQTTRKTQDRDVVKVTYQTYDDTYRRPNKPFYYNRHDDKHNSFNSYRRDKPNALTGKENSDSSARSNDETVSTTSKVTNTKVTTTKATTTKVTTTKMTDKSDKTIDNIKPTTENLYKLVTFGYVGTYRGADVINVDNHATNNDKNLTNNDRHKNDRLSINDNNSTKSDTTDNKDVKRDTISKDFSTYVTKKPDISNDENQTMKLSTFFLYDSTTKPYSNLQRPTRRNDDEAPNNLNANSKYYYVKNILHKYPENSSTLVKSSSVKPAVKDKKDIIRENYNNPGRPGYMEIEERSAVKSAFSEEVESKSVNPGRLRIKLKKPPTPAKTPSVAFQVIPSENNPSQWAIYEENGDLTDDLPYRMPQMKADPHALKEIPRPMDLSSMRKRRPGRL